jgi:TetR/AcrR family transcriptional repressor of nem operon
MDDHIGRMSKPSNRDKILTEGLRVVHEHGFAGASVRDIVQAAGVPQGSFTNHFASKEAFGLEVIDLYIGRSREVMRQTLRNEALAPLQRLHAYLAARKARLAEDGMRNGCLFGNLTAEANEHGEPIRDRVLNVFAESRDTIADCLRAAAQAGEVAQTLDCDEVAAFFVASLQGAILLAKAERSLAPMERFEKILFATVLRGA